MASNFPKSSVGSSIFSEGRSSIGIKSSSSAPDKILLSSSITGSAFFCGCGFTTTFFSSAGLLAFVFFSGACAGTAFSITSGAFSVTTLSSVTLGVAGVAVFTLSTSFCSAASAFLRGRPTLRLGAAVFSALTLFALSSFLEGCCGLAGAASLAFSASPSLVAETTLLSFLAGATRERFFFCSSLRSSLSLSAATFFVAPAIACSSSIL